MHEKQLVGQRLENSVLEFDSLKFMQHRLVLLGEETVSKTVALISPPGSNPG